MRSRSFYTQDAAGFPIEVHHRIQLKAICNVAQRLDLSRAISACSSNFSLRKSSSTFYISKSGEHKRNMTPSSFLCVDLRGNAIHPMSPKPSDETQLHAMIYDNVTEAGVVLHCHAPELLSIQSHWHCNGQEMLKALGSKTHDVQMHLPVFENHQDMSHLRELITRQLWSNSSAFGRANEAPVNDSIPMPALLLAKHGIYVWGHSVGQAEQRLEAILHLYPS